MTTILIVSVVLLWIVVLLNLILTLALIRRTGLSPAPTTGLKAGQQAPSFTAETLQGESVTLTSTLTSYPQRALVLLFVGPRCSACHEALPRFGELSPMASRSGVQFVLVSAGDRQQTQHLITGHTLGFPILVAPRDDNPFLQDYQVDLTPSYCMIDPQGMVRSAGHTSQSGGKWQALATTWEKRAKSIPVAVLSLGGEL